MVLLALFCVYVLVFLLGISFGSFATCVLHRLKTGESLLGRSQCPRCQAILRAHELVPCASWLLQRGKCRGCRRPISWKYPLIEVLMGVLCVIAYSRHPFVAFSAEWSGFLYEAALAWILLVISAFDLEWQLLPVTLLMGATPIFAGWSIALLHRSWPSTLLGMAFAFIFLGLQYALSRGRWIGEGDLWLGLFLGAALGWPLVGISIYFTYIIAGAVAAILVFAGWRKRGERIAFAPFLALGCLLALWIGPLLEAVYTYGFSQGY